MLLPLYPPFFQTFSFFLTLGVYIITRVCTYGLLKTKLDCSVPLIFKLAFNPTCYSTNIFDHLPRARTAPGAEIGQRTKASFSCCPDENQVQ